MITQSKCFCCFSHKDYFTFYKIYRKVNTILRYRNKKLFLCNITLYRKEMTWSYWNGIIKNKVII